MEELRGIVRIAGKDLKGEIPIPLALSKIKGVGTNLAKAISKTASKELGINEKEKIGMLTEEQSKKLEDIVINPSKHNLPTHMLNRRQDRETGEDKHLLMHDLDFTKKGDIDVMKKTHSYKGIRHQTGLTVRGQRTRTSGRKGATVGVTRRKGMKKGK